MSGVTSYPVVAILDRVIIIKREDDAIMLLSVITALVILSRADSTLRREILKDILLESLTTMLFLYTYV